MNSNSITLFDKLANHAVSCGAVSVEVLGQMKPPPMPEAIPCNPCKAEKRTKKMSRYYDEDLDAYIERDATDTSRSQEYFLRRISNIGCQKDEDLRRQFGLIEDESPQSFEEFMARISAGKFSFKNEDGKKSRYWRDYIIWRDPSVKKDQEGYDAAHKAFWKDADKVKDIVMALPAAEAMAAVQSLESWTTK